MFEIPDDGGLLMLRRAVSKVKYLNDSLLWETLGQPLARELAKVEGSWFSDGPTPISESARYTAENIDDAIRTFTLLKGTIR